MHAADELVVCKVTANGGDLPLCGKEQAPIFSWTALATGAQTETPASGIPSAGVVGGANQITQAELGCRMVRRQLGLDLALRVVHQQVVASLPKELFAGNIGQGVLGG